MKKAQYPGAMPFILFSHYGREDFHSPVTYASMVRGLHNDYYHFLIFIHVSYGYVSRRGTKAIGMNVTALFQKRASGKTGSRTDGSMAEGLMERTIDLFRFYKAQVLTLSVVSVSFLLYLYNILSRRRHLHTHAYKHKHKTALFETWRRSYCARLGSDA
jgi:hypothetical protein